MRPLLVLPVLLVSLALPLALYASETDGTIDPSFKTSKVCQTADCSSFHLVNWKPTLGTAVHITDGGGLTGNIWGEKAGWINLHPTGSGVSINPSTGALSGFAWGNTSAWINFSPSLGGVSIDSTGKFTGFAWVSGANGGWMKFDCNDPQACVKTDWRPVGARTPAPTPAPSFGGGIVDDFGKVNGGTGGGGGGGGITTEFGATNGGPVGSGSSEETFDLTASTAVPLSFTADLFPGSRGATGLSFLENIKTGKTGFPAVPAQRINQLLSTSQTLRIGTFGLGVQTLQKLLNPLGFSVARIGAGSPGRETTVFGPATKAALIKFQNTYASRIAQPFTPGVFDKNTQKFVATILNETKQKDGGINIAIAFSQNVQTGKGTVSIKRVSDGATIGSIDASKIATKAGSPSASFSVVADLETNVPYYITMTAGSLKDASGNDLPAITSPKTMVFVVNDPKTASR